MGDIIKWVILGAILVGITASLIYMLPFGELLEENRWEQALGTFTENLSPYVGFASGTIGYLFFEWMHPLVLSVFAYILLKPFIIGIMKITRGIYAWIFK